MTDTTATDATPINPAAMGRLDGRVAIVTGASGGLGARFARVLHATGADVVVAARRIDRLQALADELGERVHPVACDVAVDDDRVRLVDETVGRLGAVDILVNNAGVNGVVAAEDELVDDFRRVLEVNVVGLFHLCQLAGRHMLARGDGSIVNIASILGLVASAPIKQASYCASKGAVVNLTRELGAQWANRGVRVNAIAPGWFPSEMTHGMWDDDRSLDFIRRNTPARRSGREDELDGALLFLAGPGSTYVSGQVIAVDGGWTAR